MPAALQPEKDVLKGKPSSVSAGVRHPLCTKKLLVSKAPGQELVTGKKVTKSCKILYKVSLFIVSTHLRAGGGEPTEPFR